MAVLIRTYPPTTQTSQFSNFRKIIANRPDQLAQRYHKFASINWLYQFLSIAQHRATMRLQGGLLQNARRTGAGVFFGQFNFFWQCVLAEKDSRPFHASSPFS